MNKSKLIYRHIAFSSLKLYSTRIRPTPTIYDENISHTPSKESSKSLDWQILNMFVKSSWLEWWFNKVCHIAIISNFIMSCHHHLRRKNDKSRVSSIRIMWWRHDIKKYNWLFSISNVFRYIIIRFVLQETKHPEWNSIMIFFFSFHLCRCFGGDLVVMKDEDACKHKPFAIIIMFYVCDVRFNMTMTEEEEKKIFILYISINQSNGIIYFCLSSILYLIICVFFFYLCLFSFFM